MPRCAYFCRYGFFHLLFPLRDCLTRHAWRFLCPGIRQKGRAMNEKSSPVTCEEKATVWDRRVALLEYLRKHDRTTIDELSNKLNVSRRTVLRDITALTQEHAVETVRGRYGGVYLSKDKTAKRLTESQKRTLKELLTVASPEQQHDIRDIISKFGD